MFCQSAPRRGLLLTIFLVFLSVPGCATGITKENFDKIQVGMEFDAVIKIMGREGEAKYELRKDGKTYPKEMTWTTLKGDATIIVEFGPDRTVKKKTMK